MGLEQKALAQKEALLPQWIHAFLASYPLGSSGLMRAKKDVFANPIGEITAASLTILFDAIMGKEMEPAIVKDALTSLIQLRAIQDMLPSTALGPFFQIKGIIQRDLLVPAQKADKAGTEMKAFLEEFLLILARVDSLAIMAFDIYNARREKVSQIRIDEIKRSQSQVVRWAKLREGDDQSSQNYKREG